MKLDLKGYTVPAEYPAIYQHNFDQIDRIENDLVLNGLVLKLSQFSGVDYKIVLLDLKRYLMNSTEYWPVDTSVNNLKSSNLQKRIVGRLQNIFSTLFRKHDERERLDIMIDDFSEGVIDTLYSKELINQLKKSFACSTVNFSKHFPILPRLLLKSIPSLLKMIIYNKKIIKKHSIDLKKYIACHFVQFLSGRMLRSLYQPKLIISGNDNGFPVVIGKTAGAEVLLIQNAKKSLFSDATFKYADYFISMGDLDYSQIRQKTGCYFKNVYAYGSIRLHSCMNRTDVKSIEKRFDILWISDLELTTESEATFGCYYSMKSEISAIKMLNEIAERGNFRIAYKCRMPNEIELLKTLGLINDRLTYIGRFEEDTYLTVLKSELVLSTVSSVVLEAMGIGKKVGYINLSGNNNVNYDIRELDLEFTHNSKESFEQFINRVRNAQIDYSKHIKQNPKYASDLLSLIGKIVKVDPPGRGGSLRERYEFKK